MPIVYDLGTRLYHLGIRAAAPFVPKAGLWVEGRRGLWQRLEAKRSELHGCLWMHCASMGEFEQGRPVLEELKRVRPELPVLLTFYSPSGYQLMKKDPIATHVEYLPPDSRANATRFQELIQPTAAVFVKYEFWYHHLKALEKQPVPTFLISARFRPEQPFFKWFGGTHRAMLQAFKHIFVQDQRSADLLRSIGHVNATASGDTRADRVMNIVRKNEEFALAKKFREKADGPVLICGSTWPQDEEVLLPALKDLKKQPFLIVAPHELDETRVIALAKRFPGTVSRWEEDQLKPGSRTLLIDTIGPLARAYKYGDIAYVGGGFVDGIHNLLEPAAWGLPVIFGPNHHKFEEAKGLIDAGAGFTVKNSKELVIVLRRLLNDEGARAKAGAAAAEYVRHRSGATTSITASILKMT